MNIERIQHSLQNLLKDDRRWAHQGRRLVFWYDPAGEFSDIVSDLRLPEAQVLVQGQAPFALKQRLLLSEPDVDFVLYAPFAEPPPAENWLLDLQFTGVPFSADRAALIFTDLGFLHRPLEQLVRAHLKFFESKKRLADLQALSLPPEADERTLATGLLAVLAGVRVADGALIVRRVLSAGLEEGDNLLWKDVLRFGTAPLFWTLVQAATGYTAREPTLRQLFLTLLLAHLQRTLRGHFPTALQAHLLPNGTRAYALLDAWLRDRDDAARLEELTRAVQGDLGIEEWASSRPLEEYQEADTFPALEHAALRSLVQALSADTTNLAQVQAVAQSRQTLHYARPYAAQYQAVLAAAQLLTLQRSFTGTFRMPAPALLERYTSDLFLFDRLYRTFVAATDRAEGDLLTPLKQAVEHLYVRWYLDSLGEAWSDVFDETLPSQLPPTRRQWNFFDWQVRPLLDRSERDRVVVIISDALRYEVATELRERLTNELRGESGLTSMLSALPSQTRWGMSALLPGEPLTWDTKAERVLRGDQPTAGTDTRAQRLREAGYPSKTLKLDEVLALSVDEGRAAIDGARVVYVYHDAIDARGDKLASERDVFSACSEAVDELTRGVKRFAHSLNSSTILITSDHGFLYQRAQIQEADKLNVPAHGAEVSVERRAIIGPDLPETPGTVRVNLERYQTMQVPMTALFPRGSVRFRTSGGGAQYVHGGASLQEMVVPVLTYRHKRPGAGVEEASRKVGVQIVARSRKVTNNIFVVQLLQTEAAAERVRARSVDVRMIDPVSGRAVTNVRRVILASTSVHPGDREQAVQLSVTLNQPDPTVGYLLTVTDAEDQVELAREAWTISIAFKDDFGEF